MSETHAAKIARWRAEHVGRTLTEDVLCDIIGADLRGADLWDADLRDANLRYADLRDADLWSADLRDANLGGADLREADLREANLRGADLWGGFRLDGLPSGQVTMAPTSDGWHLRVGCWSGTIDDLEALARGDGEWPDAEGEERERRRPGLLALIPVLRAHVEYHHHRLVAVREKWGDDDESEKAMRWMGDADE